MPGNHLGTYDTGTIATAYFTSPVTRGQRVTLTGGTGDQGAASGAVADATTPGDGVADIDITPTPGVPSTYYGPVRMYNNGSFPLVAAGAIALTDLLYAAPNGQVSNAATAGGLATPIGKPMRAASAAGEIINGTAKLV